MVTGELCGSINEVSALCAVKNMIWIGTSFGEIEIFDAKTRKKIFRCLLLSEDSRQKLKNGILKILHIEENRTVVVSDSSGHIWMFHDRIKDNCLSLQYHDSLEFPCYALIKVNNSLD